MLLGHTLDDQAESVLLALARGSGARSLAAMAERRGLWRRPFLGMRRADTEAVCAVLGLEYWTDPTNGVPAGPAAGPGSPGAGPGCPVAGPVEGPVENVMRRRLGAGEPHNDILGAVEHSLPLRSRVRTEVLPVMRDVLGADVPVALARTAALLRDDADLLDALAADLLDRARADAPASTPADAPADDAASAGGPAQLARSTAPVLVALDTTTLAEAHPALRRRALRAVAIEAGCSPGALAQVHVRAMDDLVVRWHGQGPVYLPGGFEVGRRYGRLCVHPPRTME